MNVGKSIEAILQGLVENYRWRGTLRGRRYVDKIIKEQSLTDEEIRQLQDKLRELEEGTRAGFNKMASAIEKPQGREPADTVTERPTGGFTQAD